MVPPKIPHDLFLKSQENQKINRINRRKMFIEQIKEEEKKEEKQIRRDLFMEKVENEKIFHAKVINSTRKELYELAKIIKKKRYFS